MFLACYNELLDKVISFFHKRHMQKRVWQSRSPMYHQYRKDSSYLRNALYKTYNGKCIYCGTDIQQRHMQVDHILPTNRPEIHDPDMIQYIKELEENNFIPDSIENYLPSCSACNRNKSNSIFTVASIRYYHEFARKHLDRVLQIIEQSKNHEESFYEPIDQSIWKELDFKYQRDFSHVIMGYRLTDADVKSCPTFPLVDKIERQLSIVDYAIIQGEAGSGKSISLFQVAYRFFIKGWTVYQLINSDFDCLLNLPDNSENSLYIIDDAQIYRNYIVEQIISQARPNRKVLLAKTISDIINSDSVVLFNKDSVEILYHDYMNRKNDILPIITESDNSVGTHIFDIPIERRLDAARKAKTPWQFAYILRGGWKTMKELYKSIFDYNNCDLLAAAIAAFQILQLDNAVDFNSICRKIEKINSKYTWTNVDLDTLTKKGIILSKNDIRIIHLESAFIILQIFFDTEKDEKQKILIKIIENGFANREYSPLGIVWLCNGLRGDFRYYFSAEELFLTESIIDSVSRQINELRSSEEIRNMIYLLEKIISFKKDKGINLFLSNEKLLLDLINNTDSVSAEAFERLLNTLYNFDHKLHNNYTQNIYWKKLTAQVIQEQNPNYYSWGKLFNRGLSLLEKKKWHYYKDLLQNLFVKITADASINNIEAITSFLCSVYFLNPSYIHLFMPSILSAYKDLFTKRTDRIISLIDFDFLTYLCGIDFWGERKPSEEQKKTAKMIIDEIPLTEFSTIISKSTIQEWDSIRFVLYLLYVFDKEKLDIVINHIDLDQLSEKTKNIWDHGEEVTLIMSWLLESDINIAKEFLKINDRNINKFYPIMIAVDPQFAITAEKKGISIELLAKRDWNYSLMALCSLYKIDNDFTVYYLKNNSKYISDNYSNVCALDFVEKDSLEILKLIKRIDPCIYQDILSGIDKTKVLDKFDNCSGISNRKMRWVEQRKKVFFTMIGISTENINF